MECLLYPAPHPHCLYLLPSENLLFDYNWKNWNSSTNCLHFYLWNILSICGVSFSHPLLLGPFSSSLLPLIHQLLHSCCFPGFTDYIICRLSSHLSLYCLEIIMTFLFLSLCPYYSLYFFVNWFHLNHILTVIWAVNKHNILDLNT